MAKKSAANLLAQIEASKSRDLSNLIYALGFVMLATERQRHWPDILVHSRALSKATVEDLDDIPEIGLTVAQSVRDWFDDEGNVEFCRRLAAGGCAHEIAESAGHSR